jgi:hypothetical protein
MLTKNFFKKYNEFIGFSWEKQERMQNKIVSDYPIFVMWNGNRSWLRIRNTNLLICWTNDSQSWYVTGPDTKWLKSHEFEIDLKDPMRLQHYDRYVEYDLPEVISRISDDTIKRELLETLIHLGEGSLNHSG